MYRINFFRLCRIVLEDIPDVLRHVFKDEVMNKIQKPWLDNQRCGQAFLQQDRFQSNLNRRQKDLLSSGQTNDWDTTLLVHALLFSSHFLLAESFSGNQVQLKRGSDNTLVSPSKQVDFTRLLYKGDIILIDVGQNLIRNEVKFISKTEITMKFSVPSHNMPSVGDIYVCSDYWKAVEDLKYLRNEQFAHCKNARIQYFKLERVVRNIEKIYDRLRIPKNRIKEMSGILSGMCKVPELQALAKLVFHTDMVKLYQWCMGL